ncbi:hypothetical protein DYB36_014188 [Aphanomyces astaci]|uniref:Mediator complex subunit 15 KIX domain-containing protein n=1 Tax=Aphanomyces astaci TaxID=112090 RepID=A0A397A050_APHAT|nr:hypothetical protein DYB36_014188 [Aphanomyces astaci]
MVRRCSQLLRLHRGDKEQLQQTVMKYERAVWTKSADKEAYLKTLKAKMLTFKQQPTPNDATPVSPMVMLPANGDMSVPASPQVKQMETTTLMDVDIIPFSDQLQQQQQQQQQSSSSPPQPPTNLMQQQESNTMTSSTLHEQYQHRRVELIKSQYNETHQCCQSQLVQQTQLSASHVQQNTPMAARQLQMTMLQLQHDMARNNLMQHHMNQQNNLIQHHYQQLLALANQEISI